MSLLILFFSLSLSLFLFSSKGLLLIFKSFSFLSILFCSSNIFSVFKLFTLFTSLSLLSLFLIIKFDFFKFLFTDFFLIFFVTTFLGLLVLLLSFLLLSFLLLSFLLLSFLLISILLLSFLLLFPLIILFFIVLMPFKFLLSTLSLIFFFLNFLLFSFLLFSFFASKNKFFFIFSISFFSNNCNWLLFINFSLTFLDKFSSTSLSNMKVIECLWPWFLNSWLLSFLNEVCFNILFNLFIFFLLLVLPPFFPIFLSSVYKGLNILYSSFLFFWSLTLFFTGERFVILSSLNFFHISFILELLLSLFCHISEPGLYFLAILLITS